MKTLLSLLNKTKKEKLVLLGLLIAFAIACSKDQSSQSSASIFTGVTPKDSTLNDNNGAIEVGMKFQSSKDGTITGIKFYKTTANTGIHTGELYSGTGALLASKVFTNETALGWQVTMFDQPVAITANTTYVAAYHSSLGNYTATDYGLLTPVVKAPLTALANDPESPNGIFKYSHVPAFPDTTYLADNYWVDVAMNPK
jgi:uncharacterized protein DUF4082